MKSPVTLPELLEARIAPAFTSIVDLSLLTGDDGFQISRPAPPASDQFAQELSGIGDINGDGIDDFILTAAGAGAGTGILTVVFGRSTGFPADLDLTKLSQTEGFRIDGEAPGDLAGASVAGIGDANGDGLDDFIIGAPGFGMFDAGAAYVVYGQTTAFPATASLANPVGFILTRFVGETPEDRAGATVSGAGDFNGDGLKDIVIGAPGAMTGAGTAYVVFGASAAGAGTLSLGGINGANGFRVVGDSGHRNVGLDVASLGDVNGDGMDDVIFGSQRINGIEGSTSYVVFGRGNTGAASVQLGTLNGTNGFAIEGGAYLGKGVHVAGAGDVNGDGLMDILIASGRVLGKASVAHASVVFGKSDGFPATFPLSALDGTNGFRVDFGKFRKVTFSSVAAAGDVNSDGFADIAVGSAGFRGKANPDGADPNFGLSYVIFGHADPFEAEFDAAVLEIGGGFTIVNDPGTPFIVTAVRAAGDVNGDGLDDVMIGSSTRADLGSGYVVFGKPIFIATNPDADTVKFNEADGDLITITAGGRTLAPENFTFDPTLRQDVVIAGGAADAASFGLVLGTEFTNATVKIKAATSSGGTGGASMSQFAAPGVALKKVKIVGSVERIIAGSGQSAIGKLVVDTLGPQTGVGVSEFSGPVTSIKIRDEMRNATIEVNSALSSGLKSMLVEGNITNSTISSTGTLKIVVDGSVLDSAFDAAASLKLGVVGDVQNSILRALGDTTSEETASKKVIKKLTVNGSVENSQILAGYSPLGSLVNGAATIGKVIVKNDWIASDLAAGVDAGPDGVFGTADDVAGSSPFFLSSRIAKIVVKGFVEGTSGVATDHFGFVAEEIGSFKAAGVAQPLAEGANNDLTGFSLGTAGDFLVREVIAQV